MTTRIMVPVKGTQDVGIIAPSLQTLIDRGGVGKVTLVRVAPFAPAVAVDFALEYADVMAADEARREEARVVLRSLAEKISWGSTDHELVALLGDETDALARFAAARSFDSVLLVSRRHSRLRRIVAGNLSDRILDTVCIPITVLPCPECVHPLGMSV